MDSIYTVLITLITILGSTSAWQFYEKRVSRKEKLESYMKDDCKSRIIKLEQLLETSSKEKEEMRKQILNLTKEVSELRVKVSFMEKENKKLVDNSNLKL